MERLFPKMYDRPEARPVGVGAVYWFVFLIILPTLLFRYYLPFSFEGDYALFSWISIVYYAINFVVVFLLFRGYLADSFLNVRLEKTRFAVTVAIASVALLLVLDLLSMLAFLTDSVSLAESLVYISPFAELPMWIPAGIMVEFLPFWGTLCLITIVPVTMCCLYYGVVFAPICVDRPWLGYLAIVLLSAVPRVVGVGSAGLPMEQLVLFLIQLPWHLIACWSYQKSDTIWAPIGVYSAVNLVCSLRMITAMLLATQI